MCLRHIVEHSHKAKEILFQILIAKNLGSFKNFLFYFILFIYLFFVTRDISKICHGVQDTTL